MRLSRLSGLNTFSVRRYFFMAIDKLTVYVENGQIVNVVPDDPSKTIAEDLTPADYEAIVKNGYQVMVSSTCSRYPNGLCYYVIGGRKYRCTCP
jgi:hypothetical protein